MIAPEITPGDWETVGSTKIVVFGEGYASIALACNPRPQTETVEPHGHVMEPADFANPRFMEACSNTTMLAAAPALAEALNALYAQLDPVQKPHLAISIENARDALLRAGYTEDK